ncbi:hypothetical protein ABT288_20465 [Streptomyces sp. NPDC001093]|uniref:SCO2400 family protein n=1 Tax=Streptomyces sp. NPDC001093 TaxID=3154376 RepID=UPI00332B8A71
MDYCHPCQRHLNGALACPGCGTPARAVAEAPAAYARAGTGETQGYGVPQPYGSPQYDSQQYSQQYGSPEYRVPHQYEPAGPEQAAWAEEREQHENWVPGTESEPATEAEAAADSEPEPDPESEPGGRAARRRTRGGTAVGPAEADASRRDRKAAAHRRRRRRTVLITAGFVLAAGSLGLAELGTDAPFSPFSSGQPDSAANTAADGGTSSASPGATASDTSGAAPGSASPDASASASKSPKDKHSKSPDAKNTDKATQTAATGSGATHAAPAPTATSRPTSTPTSAPTSSPPSPTPSPTKTCTRFLWWCS